MKKVLLLNAIILAMFSSCGEDREDENTSVPTTSQKIVGTWTITKKESNNVVISAPTTCQNHGSFTFTADKKLSEVYNSTVSGACTSDTDNFSYTIDENTNKVTTKNSLGDTEIWTISGMTDHAMVLTNVDGTDTTRYTFTK